MARFYKLFVTVIACAFFCVSEAQVQPDFAAVVPAGCAPIVVRFSDSTKGSPTKWQWDFGNGNTSSLQNPSEVYTTAGQYSVKLTVSNSNSSSSTTKNIIIIGSIKAGFTYQYDNVCSAPSSFTFNASNYQDTVQYLWNFGNGKTATGSSVSTIFATNGNDNVRLITSTRQGCNDTAIQTFSIGSAVASFSSYSVVCKNAPATFTNTSNPNPLSISWYINGTLAGNGNMLTHTFTTAGNYDIKMIAGFGNCTQSAQKTITVKDKPVAGFSQSGNLQSCTLSSTITFTNSSTNADTYQWLFGDGNLSTQTDINYTYNKAGTFSPSLVAFNGDGCSDTVSKNALVRLGPPVISSFTALPKSGCVPEDITSDANITSPDPVVSYDWNTGDNNLHVSGSQLSHTYSTEGYYNVSLTVTTQNGCTGSYTLKQAVAAGTKPTADFTVDKAAVCAAVPVQFIDKSVGTVTSWNYNFGDGLSTSGSPNPVHVFTKIGSNDVTLYESNKGCNADPKTIKNIVTILPPIAGFTFDYNCLNPLQVQFTDHSQQPNTWQWDFDDSQTSSLQSPQHMFAKAGTYAVKLKAGNNNGCTSSDTAIIVVTDEKPILQMQPANGFVCRNDSIRFTAASNSGSIIKYTWNLGDGSVQVNDSMVSHIYTKNNDYNPFVTVQYVNKCSQNIYFNSPLHVYGPTAFFTTSQNGDCLPLDVTFTNQSNTDNIHNIVTDAWVYGNGETDNVNAVTHLHTYQSGGSFTPKLMITDAIGCTDSFTSVQPIIAKGALADFTYIVKASCDSAVVTFTNASLPSNDVIANYSWSFGDASPASTAINPQHTYYSSGVYKITLTVITKSGCTATSVQTITVTIATKPIVTLQTPSNACLFAQTPLSASISGNAPVQQWTWNLGDGSQQTGQNITAVYIKSGSYTITAIAVLNGNCFDSANQKITVYDLPQTDAGLDNFVCAGNTISLQASGADLYAWQQVNNELSCTRCASPVAQPATSTNYVVTGTNTFGCTSSDTVFIAVQSRQTVSVTSNDFAICTGNSVQPHASGTDIFNWQPGTGLNDNTVADPIATPANTTIYTVTGSDSHHCFTDSKAVTVNVQSPPQFNIVDSTITIARGLKHTMTTTSSSDVVKWLWKPATGLSCSDCATPVLSASISGIYTAIATTAAGCSDSDAVRVTLLCDKAGIFLPTAFTPNSDGKNDFFYPLSFADSKIISFTIFNRNGVVVFHKENTVTGPARQGWDGTYRSQLLPTDTYIYKIEVECENDIIPFTGTVMLIR